MTGERAPIDALGTWMIDLPGCIDGRDLSLTLPGTTQITSFQRRSLSLHTLKDQGIDCGHILTKKGNFLDLWVDDVYYRFPLLTINGGDYVEIHVHPPPSPTVASINVSRLDPTKNFPTDGLYYLLHL